MVRYALRYVPLLILALLLIPLRLYMAGMAQQAAPAVTVPAFPFYQVPTSYGHYSALYSITTLSSGDAWAVGGSFSLKSVGQGGTGAVLEPASGIILHYADNIWSAATVAIPLKLPLLSVSLDSPRDGWAAGWDGTLVHFDGNTWSTVPGPANFKQNLPGIVVLSPADGWAVGYSGSILHYDGKQWMKVASPTTADLHGIAMVSAREGWAVGNNEIILHYSNGTWSRINHAPTGETLDSIAMLSAGEGWAVGRQGTILHYRDGTWESVHPVSFYGNAKAYQSVDFLGVAMNSIRSGWIVAGQHFLTYSAEAWIEPDHASNPFSVSYPGIAQNNLTLYAVAFTSASEGWAVGGIYSYKTTDAGVMLHYVNGVWNVYGGAIP